MARFYSLFTSIALAMHIAPSNLTEYRREYFRKILHIVAGIVPVVLFIFMDLDGVASLMFLAAAFFATLRMMRIMGFVGVVTRTTWGEIFFPVGIGVAALSSETVNGFVLACLVLGLSDALASIVGLAYAKRKFHIFGHWKSFIGSSTFFVTTVFLLAFLSPMLTSETIPIILGIAGLLTLLEAVLIWGLDNLALPVLATILFQNLLS